MRVNRKGKALRAIADIRKVQCHVAELSALRALQALDRTQSKQRKQQDELQHSLKGWQHHLKAPRFDPVTLGFWSATVTGGTAALAQIEDELVGMRYERDQAQNGWAQANARQEIGFERVTQHQKYELRLRDERRLHELAERPALRAVS